MEMPPRPLPSPRRPALLRPSCSRRKGIWPRAFPFHPKASNLAYPEARRTERPAQTAVRAADQGATGEQQTATAGQKKAGGGASTGGTPPPTTKISALGGHPKTTPPPPPPPSPSPHPTPKTKNPPK